MQEPHMWELMRGREKENRNCLKVQWAEYSGIQVTWSSVVQLCLTLCDPMDSKTPSLPVHHKFPKLAQTHVHQVIDAIQLSHPLLSSSPALNLSQHQKESESEVTQSCLTLCNPMDCSPPGSSIHGIFQARILEWIAILFSRASFQPRDRTQVLHITGRLYTLWARESIIKLLTNSEKSKCKGVKK